MTFRRGSSVCHDQRRNLNTEKLIAAGSRTGFLADERSPDAGTSRPGKCRSPGPAGDFNAGRYQGLSDSLTSLLPSWPSSPPSALLASSAVVSCLLCSGCDLWSLRSLPVRTISDTVYGGMANGRKGIATIRYILVLRIGMKNPRIEPARCEPDMSELLSTQNRSQQLMPPQDARRSRYNSVMRLYLIGGAAGLLIWIGFTLDDLGWLEPAIEFLFGGYADRILGLLNMLSVMVSLFSHSV